MNTFTTVFQHIVFGTMTMMIDIHSRLTPAQVKSDATAIIELADDFIEGADIELGDWQLIEIQHMGAAIVTFAR